jgi:CRP-like cAMP-binding protein
MEVSNIKYFLRVFLPLLDRKKDRAAIRFMYRHTAFLSIGKGRTLFKPNSSAANGNLIIVADGLVNGYLANEETGQTNIWLGMKDSVYICDHFKQTDHHFNLLAIEDTIVFVIDQTELAEGCAWYPVLDSLFNTHLLQTAISDVNNRNILFRLQNIENRISLFKRIYPGLFDRMPTDLLLSYLDIDLSLTREQTLHINSVYNEDMVTHLQNQRLKEQYLD